MRDNMDVVHANRQVYLDEYHPFRRAFNAPLSAFWEGPYLGFDIVKFDEEIIGELPDGTSTQDAVRERYGDEGVRVIRKLLHMESEE